MNSRVSLDLPVNSQNEKPSVSIGILAYNEAANIGKLLTQLMRQNQNIYNLDKIIVSSDGSTDDTNRIVRSFAPNVTLFANRNRRGMARGNNQITKACRSDILILLNADLLLDDSSFIDKLILPLIEKKVDLVAPASITLPPASFVQTALTSSHQIKTAAYAKYNSGNNIYTCSGLARAFSKRLYSKLHFPTSIAEDAYSYLFCISQGYTYAYQPETRVVFQVPASLKDYFGQSSRFSHSQRILSKHFNINFIRKNYYLPRKIIIRELIYEIFNHPVAAISYLIFFITMHLVKKSIPLSNQWNVAVSSKKLIIKAI